MTRLSIVQGDTAILRIPVLNPDGTPISLATFHGIYFTIKRSKYDSDFAAIFQGSLEDGDIEVVGEDADGILDVTVPHTNTVQMRPGRPYYWDVELVEDETGAVATPCFGTIFAEGEVTQTIATGATGP
jgi:hypothetical protein